jgi:hypothetical protein
MRLYVIERGDFAFDRGSINRKPREWPHAFAATIAWPTVSRNWPLGGSSPRRSSVWPPWRRKLTESPPGGPARPTIGHYGHSADPEWQGMEHSVTVRDEEFEYQGRPYKSLSAIARLITGTRWNGWIFFGLKNQRARP